MQEEIMTESCDTRRLIPDSVIRKMTSKAQNYSHSLPIFMIHPVQGTVELLEQLVSFLERPVWGLEFTEDAPSDSAASVAAFYIEAIRSKQAKGPYTLVAYSLGCTIGFEVALKLETEGEKVLFICLDGSPAFVKSTIQLTTKTQSRVANRETFGWPYLTTLFTNLSFSYLQNETERMAPARRNKWCCDLLRTDPPTFKRALNLYWAKVSMCEEYEPSGKLQSSVWLIKATENYLTDIDNEYDLSKHCSAVETWEIPNTTHETIIKGKAAQEVAKIINSST